MGKELAQAAVEVPDEHEPRVGCTAHWLPDYFTPAGQHRPPAAAARAAQGGDDAVTVYDVPRGNCRYCGHPINTRDYWFWWLRQYHRKCKVRMRKVRE